MDADSAVQAPSSFQQAHETWFTGMYTNGVQHARGRLQQYSTTSMLATDYKDLSDDLKDAISQMAEGNQLDTYCPSTFSYPTAS